MTKMAKNNVMIVDDDTIFLEELRETLLNSGYSVISVKDGSTALYLARIKRPDLILLDIKMSGLNGFQVVDRLKRDPETQKIPVIAMTGYFMEEEHEWLQEICEMKTCLKKPFYPLDVINKVEEVFADVRNMD